MKTISFIITIQLDRYKTSQLIYLKLFSILLVWLGEFTDRLEQLCRAHSVCLINLIKKSDRSQFDWIAGKTHLFLSANKNWVRTSDYSFFVLTDKFEVSLIYETKPVIQLHIMEIFQNKLRMTSMLG